MNGLDQRRHGSVTERLGARLHEVEPLVDALMQNQAKLIADSVTTIEKLRAMNTAIDAAETRFKALDAAISQFRTQHRVCNAEDRLASLEIFRTCGTFWQRLRWLVRGSA